MRETSRQHLYTIIAQNPGISANAALRAMQDQGIAIGRRQDALDAVWVAISETTGRVPLDRSAAKREAGAVGGLVSSFVRSSKVTRTLPKAERQAVSAPIRLREKRVREEKKEAAAAFQAQLDSLESERATGKMGLKGQERKDFRYQIWKRMRELYENQAYEELEDDDLRPQDFENLQEVMNEVTFEDPDTRAAVINELYDFMLGDG